MKPSSIKHRKATSLVKQLVRVRGGARHHEAHFDAILPSAMKELVAMGLFESWEGTYRITTKGKQVLREMELEKQL